MAKIDVLDQIVREKMLPEPQGMFSICSSNIQVLRACMKRASMIGGPLLIESTCNQVNQFGGYMNMTPVQFAEYVETIADETGFPHERILLGGDHLGPSAWKQEPAESAMQKSADLIRACIRAGYRKIHLDASMPCGDDPSPLPPEIVAEREARLCRAGIEAQEMQGGKITDLAFVVGTEVPTPGGSSDEEQPLHISTVKETGENITAIREAFRKNHLEAAWERVRAFVVQPGVEFSDSHIHIYEHEKARALSTFIEGYENLIYEAHSTDYQTGASLRQMVEDHFAILKVGPELTHALREALFSLEEIEKEIYHGSTMPLSGLKAVLDEAMTANPQFWKQYYSKDSRIQFIQRRYSLLDRSRYYLNSPKVGEALRVLKNNLSKIDIPVSLISQFFPDQTVKIKEGMIEKTYQGLIEARIFDVFDRYNQACGKHTPIYAPA